MLRYFTIFGLRVLVAACADDPKTAPAEPVKAVLPTLPETAAAPPICSEATGQYEATRAPSNVLFLYDRSGSMHIVLPSNVTRWSAAENALFELLEDMPGSVSAGLMLFPQGDAPVNAYCGIDASTNDVSCRAGWPEPTESLRCDASTYAPSVASAPLDDRQISAIESAVRGSDDAFYWGTPLSTALAAAIAAQRASNSPGAKSIVLVTDGNPTSCDAAGISDDIGFVVDAAKGGLDPANGAPVRTYVIGLTDSSRQAAKASNLSPIAVAGGTARSANCEEDDSCFYALTDRSFAQDLASVFDDISRQEFDCTFDLPTASADTDPTLINVEVAGATVARDPAHRSGWDYVNGTQVRLFGDACTAMKDDAAKLDIVLGCKTIIVR